MSSRTSLRPNAVISAASMAADITSKPTILNSLTRVSYAVQWAGTTPIGNLQVEVSDDYVPNPDGSQNTSGTWNVLPLDLGGVLVTQIPITGNTGNGFIDVQNTAAYAMRLHYLATSGVGALTALVNAKVA